MIYISEVAILFNKRAMERMPKELKEILDETFVFSKDIDDGYRLYHDASLEWYQEYEDVKKITQFMKSLSEDEDGGGEFMRIGQDEDDIERNSYGDHSTEMLWLSRSITLEGKEIMEIIGG